MNSDEEKNENYSTDDEVRVEDNILHDGNQLDRINSSSGLETRNYSDSYTEENDLKDKNDDKNDGKRLLDETKQQVEEGFNEAFLGGVKNINKQIGNANENLSHSVDIYNSTLSDRENAIKAYRESFSEVIGNVYDKLSGQARLGDERLKLITEQEVLQQKFSDSQKQLGYLQKDMQELAQKEQNEETGEEEGANPLISSGYMRNLLEFLKRQSEKDAQIKKRNIGDENKILQKKEKAFQKEQASRRKKTQNKANALARALDKIFSRRKRYNSDIDRDYKRFDMINKKYKKILGLKKKYKDEINSTSDVETQKDLVEKFKSDINKIARARASDMQEESNKFDKNGNRIETAKEKKERKEKEKQDKEDAKKKKQNKKKQQIGKKNNEYNNNVQNKEGNSKNNNEDLAKKLQDSNMNNDVFRQNLNDKMLKNAYNNLNLSKNKKNNEFNGAKKMQISNISDNNESIHNDVNVPTIKTRDNIVGV